MRNSIYNRFGKFERNRRQESEWKMSIRFARDTNSNGNSNTSSNWTAKQGEFPVIISV